MATAGKLSTVTLRVGFNARTLRDDGLRGLNRYTICLLKALEEIAGAETVLFTDQRSPVHPTFTGLLKAPIVTLASPRVLVWEHLALPRALR